VIISLASFPAGSFQIIEEYCSLFMLFTEPIGSVPPKVGIADELSNTRTVLGASFSLKCPAQSYPIPAYRYVYSGSFLGK